VYRFRGSAGDPVTIYVGSINLDMMVVLADSSGKRFEMMDDDSGAGANATIDGRPPFDGLYYVMVLASREREYGAFSLAVTEGTRAKAGRDEDEAGEVHPLERTQLQWPQFGSADSSVGFYDRESVVHSGDLISVQTRLAYREVRRPSAGAAYDSRLMRVEIRCASREYRVRTLVDTRGGVPVDRAEAEGDFSAIPPGSIMQGLRDMVCG
jgi:hypothetical protein